MPPERKNAPVSTVTSAYLHDFILAYRDNWDSLEKTLTSIFKILPDGDDRMVIKNEFFMAALTLDSHAVDSIFPNETDSFLYHLARKLEEHAPEIKPSDTLLDYRQAWDQSSSTGNTPFDQVTIRFIERSLILYKMDSHKGSICIPPTKIIMTSYLLATLCDGWWKDFSEKYQLTDE